MVVSETLGLAARLLFKERLLSCTACVHQNSVENLGRFVVVLSAETNKGTRKASGVAKSEKLAFTKAVAELGEELLCDSLDLSDRSGIAAGFLFHEAAKRAKAELVERDSFLYHYKNRIPFLSSLEIESPFGIDMSLTCFEMDAKISNFRAVFVTDQEVIRGTPEYVVFGTASHPDFELAKEKAIEEYVAVTLTHRMLSKDDVIERVASGKKKSDKHLLAGWDPRNIEIIRSLCQTSTASLRLRDKSGQAFKVHRLASPLYGFTYAQANHPQLDGIVFGQPESSDSGTQLFHPFW